MKIRLLYNPSTQMYRAAYKKRWWKQWKFIMMSEVETHYSPESKTNYREIKSVPLESKQIGILQEAVEDMLRPSGLFVHDEWKTEDEIELPKGTEIPNQPDW